jgi:hypothetical protein
MRPRRGCLLFDTDLQWRKTDRVANAHKRRSTPLCSAGKRGYGGVRNSHE